MSARRAARRSFSGRIRAGLAAAGVVALATGLGIQGTLAYWTDSANVSTGSITAGTFDLTLNNTTSGTQLAGAGGTWTNASINPTSLAPGESIAYAITLNNAGTTPVVWNVTGSDAGTIATSGAGLRAWVQPVSAISQATNAGAQNTGNRTGSCAGTAASDSNAKELTTTAGGTDLLGDQTSIAPGASQAICVVVRLAANADTALQGKTGTITLTFNGRQVGA